jgi:hypothetical protein
MKNIGKKRKNIWLDVIKDIWNGEHSLVYSFWILYVVYISALAGIAFYFGEMLDESSIFGILLYIIFLVFIYIYSIIVSVGILRSASKYIIMKKKNNLSSFWGKLAQLVVILGIINSIIELFKLVKNF